MDILRKKLTSFFKRHEGVEIVYSTSDNLLFKEKHHAEAHAATLKTKSVTPHTRVLHESIEKAFGKFAEKQNQVTDKELEEVSDKVNDEKTEDDSIVVDNVNVIPADKETFDIVHEALERGETVTIQKSSILTEQPDELQEEPAEKPLEEKTEETPAVKPTPAAKKPAGEKTKTNNTKK